MLILKTIREKPILFSIAFTALMFFVHKVPFNGLAMDDLSSKFYKKLIINTLLILLAFVFCKSLNLLKIGGLYPFSIRNIYVFILPILYLLIKSNNFKYLRIIGIENLVSPLTFLFLLKSLSVGTLEEITFRSLFQSLIVNKYSGRYGIIGCVAISSLCFGLAHFINLLNTDPNYLYTLNGVLSQIVFAFCVGFLFGSILLVTNNIYFLSLIHALSHSSTFIQEVYPNYFTNISTPSSSSSSSHSVLEMAGSLIVLLFIFGIPTILPSLYMLKNLYILKKN